MDMQIVKSRHIPESYQKIKHASGLEILLYPMKDYSSSYALFSTKYGSVDTCFKTSADADFVEVPEGIAHFLEHKLFESEKGDAFARYAETGASANAYTSFDRTAYLFSCTDNFKQSLEILLDFVTDPYFTPETVQKEQGIIGQEITMYQDDPNWRVFFGLLGGMYQKNPVRIDIAGTIETIAKIDADLLYRCYHTFYNLHNMVLAVAGNFDPSDVLELADRILKPAEDNRIERRIPEEPAEIAQKEVHTELAVAQPLFQIGFKKNSQGEKEDFATAIKTEILLEMLAGEASPLYRHLYESGLINATFSTAAENGRGFAYSVFDGESRDPHKVQQEILAEIARQKADGLDTDAFEHCKKAIWGHYVGMFGSVTSVASVMLSAHFAGVDAFAMLDIIAATTLAELAGILSSDFLPGSCVLSVVYPKGKENLQ